jgi:DNA-directed RNA polymerase subunit RPC12/RpoP
MGYYDYPETHDYTVSFECSECTHRNTDIETSSFSSMGTDLEVDCEKCGYENTVTIEDTSPCCSSDNCHC